MKTAKLDEEILRRYLLDDVSDEEMLEIEEQFLEDDLLFEELNALEDELYYDYKQDRLNARENAVFERKFLQTAEDREKTGFADALLKASEDFVETKKEEKESVSLWQTLTSFFNTPMQFGLAAASLLVVCTLGVFVLLNINSNDNVADLPDNSLQNQNKQILAEDRKPEIENSNQQTEIAEDKEEIKPNKKDLPKPVKTAVPKQELAESQPKPIKTPEQKKQIQRKPQTSFIALVLSPGNFSRSGGDGMKRVNLNPETKNLRISLLAKNVEDYKSFRASLKTVNEGVEIWSSPSLTIQGKGDKQRVAINIPTNIIKRGDYEVSLIGTTENGETEEIDSYYFGVLK